MGSGCRSAGLSESDMAIFRRRRDQPAFGIAAGGLPPESDPEAHALVHGRAGIWRPNGAAVVGDVVVGDVFLDNPGDQAVELLVQGLGAAFFLNFSKLINQRSFDPQCLRTIS